MNAVSVLLRAAEACEGSTASPHEEDRLTSAIENRASRSRVQTDLLFTAHKMGFMMPGKHTFYITQCVQRIQICYKNTADTDE